MKLGILTSSRADFGIYLPLIRKLFQDNFFKVEIIVFGTHLSEKYGMTIKEIENEGFLVKHKLDTLPDNDNPIGIAYSIGKTIGLFSDFWHTHNYDLVFAFGDRYEMLGAVIAGSPFNVTFAHLHAGETTLGAIDNEYRHSISLMSKYLFVSTKIYRKRAIDLIKRPEDIFNVGALSIDNLKSEKLYTISGFYDKFKINLKTPTVLTTFHPETIDYKKNEFHIFELVEALKELSKNYQIVITMPNADTKGLMIRNKIEEFEKNNDMVHVVESFGMRGYLSCMKHCKILLGNTSSAFVEASYFPKWVINIGKRQNGRIFTSNILTIPIKKELILKTVKKVENYPETPIKQKIYGKGTASGNIIKILKSI